MERRLELMAEMTPAIWLHLITAILAIGIGAVVLWRRKGDGPHKLAGRIWVVLMAVVAVSSFFITEIRDGSFSLIHLLSAYTIGNLIYGIGVFRFKKRMAAIRAHQQAMRSLYILGLLIAGGFTFLPDRLLGRMISEASVVPHVILIALSLAAAAYGIMRARPIQP